MPGAATSEGHVRFAPQDISQDARYPPCRAGLSGAVKSSVFDRTLFLWYHTVIRNAGMSATEEEQEWLDGMCPADDWDAHATKRVLDELFSFARQYRSNKSYDGLLKFVARFRLYALNSRLALRGILAGCVIPFQKLTRHGNRSRLSLARLQRFAGDHQLFPGVDHKDPRRRVGGRDIAVGPIGCIP